MHHITPYTRRTFCLMALGTCAALLWPCPAFASIAQGIGMPELAPYPCRIDFPTARAEGTGLERTTTLASGGKVCDFRYKQGREVTRGWDL